MGLVMQLGRAVARGMLPLAQADAALVLQLIDAPGDPDETIRIWRHVLGQHVCNYEARREETAGRIKWQVLRSARALAPWRALMAQAHDINGIDGFHFTEPQVKAMVELLVSDELNRQPMQRRARR